MRRGMEGVGMAGMDKEREREIKDTESALPTAWLARSEMHTGLLIQ